jgi:hypothetical protein
MTSEEVPKISKKMLLLSISPLLFLPFYALIIWMILK